jgi:Na+/phosphate symporter
VPATRVLIELLGEVALLMWGIHMVGSGVQRAFGTDLRRVPGTGLRNRWTAFLSGHGVTAQEQHRHRPDGDLVQRGERPRDALGGARRRRARGVAHGRHRRDDVRGSRGAFHRDDREKIAAIGLMDDALDRLHVAVQGYVGRSRRGP